MSDYRIKKALNIFTRIMADGNDDSIIPWARDQAIEIAQIDRRDCEYENFHSHALKWLTGDRKEPTNYSLCEALGVESAGGTTRLESLKPVPKGE